MSSQGMVTPEDFIEQVKLLEQLKYQEGYANGVANEQARILKAIEDEFMFEDGCIDTQFREIVQFIKTGKRDD